MISLWKHQNTTISGVQARMEEIKSKQLEAGYRKCARLTPRYTAEGGERGIVLVEIMALDVGPEFLQNLANHVGHNVGKSPLRDEVAQFLLVGVVSDRNGCAHRITNNFR